jgi:hypothetical protein
LFLDLNNDGRYDAETDQPFAFIQVELRAPESVRRLQNRQGNSIIAADITDRHGGFRFDHIPTFVLERIQAESANNSLTVVAADAPDIPIQTVRFGPSLRKLSAAKTLVFTGAYRGWRFAAAKYDGPGRLDPAASYVL